MSSNNKYTPQGISSNSNSYEENLKIPNYSNEHVVKSTEYVKNVFKNPRKRTISYVRSLFPFIEWFPHYPTNINWVLSDFITGVTVAIVLVPQSMSYAKLANLKPEFGLYSAFIGLMFYFLFATSREICIGPVAVLSTEVGKIVVRTQAKYGNEYTANEIATTLALICGGIVLGIGLLRLGFIVEFLSLPAILAFTTGSAFNIVCGQLAGLMGFSKQAGKQPTTYQTLIAFLKHLPDTKVDAAFGLTNLFILYTWQFICDYLIKKNKHNKKKRLAYTYLLNLRTAFVIIISTCISFGVLRYRPRKEATPYSIIGVIPSGLKHVGRFVPPANLASRLASEIPICTIILVLEHISISKSFARMNGYRVNPNQEFVAIGLTNMIGTFFGAYPCTGSFSRTALSAKCGVKTPFKAAFSGACVLLAIYCFTSAFYYIPNASLCAIIIHCVTNLMADYRVTTRLYMFSPIDFIIFIVGVFITVFASIEDGIYWALCASAAKLLWNLCFPNGTFMGRIKIATIKNPIITKRNNIEIGDNISSSESDISNVEELKNTNNLEITKQVNTLNQEFVYKWVPNPKDSYNPSLVHTRYVNNYINIEQAPPNVLVYRLSESFIYTNSSLQIDHIIYKVRENFRPFNSDRERLWCEYTFAEKDWDFKSWKGKSKQFANKLLRRNQSETDDDYLGSADDDFITKKKKIDEAKPVLKILHLDFSQVVGTDSTSVQSLLDLQSTIDNYVGSGWEMHFSGIINPWVLRSLINAGFGRDRASSRFSENEYLRKNFKKLNFWNANKNKENFRDENINDEERELPLENNDAGSTHQEPQHRTLYSLYDQTFDEEIQVEVEDEDKKAVLLNQNAPIEINESVYTGDLEVGINDNGLIVPIYSTEYPNFHLDIPSYSEYDSVEF
jgi:sodium-independent sulfate anion transporter 11